MSPYLPADGGAVWPNKERKRHTGGYMLIGCTLKRGIFCLLFSTTLAAAGQASPKATSAVRELAGLNDELQTLAARISPSVVKIEVSGLTAVRDQRSPAVSVVARENSVGSGIVVAANGLILTNAHVVRHADVRAGDHLRPRVLNQARRADAGNARRLKARVHIPEQHITDIALIQVEANDLKALTLADSDLV